MATFNGTTLTDTLIGSGLSDLLYGLAGNDSLSGGVLGDGNDTLDGGTGSDTLEGGVGNDTYIVDGAKDAIVETGGDADDRIQASITIDLQSAVYDGIEHVTLTGTSALNATGDDGNNQLIGNAGANKLDGKASDDTMIGGAGNDTYEVGALDEQAIEYAAGGTDQVNSASHFILGAYVENLTLTGTDDNNGDGNALANKVTGNAGDNDLGGDAGNDTLTGNDGDDVLDGGDGADSLSGGKGNDTYVVDETGDKVTESGLATDIDRVEAFFSYVLGSNIEQLLLRSGEAIDGTGNTLANTLTGNAGDNVLSGLAGNDSLSGFAGQDLLMGGDGNDELLAELGSDTLVGGAGLDVFKFSSGADSDVVADLSALPGGDIIDLSELLTSVTAATAAQFLQTVTANGSTMLRIDTNGGANSFVDLALLQGVSIDLNGLIANAALAGIGALTATPTAGTSGADTLAAGAASTLVQGLAGNDSLTGGAGFDTLDGGTGTDTLTGGAGSDTYIVDNAADKIIESSGADDRILSAITIDLQNAAYEGVEHATLSGTGAINATGDQFANMLVGNSGANKLDGKAADDTMIGGGGSDTYEVDSEFDSIIEYAGEGTDQVNSSAEFYVLDAFVENLTLTGTLDSDADGNALANKLTGNAAGNGLFGADGNDTLTGNDGDDALDGADGADSLVGGKGNDFYVVDNVGDKISESGPSTEFDTVLSLITYTLGSTLETLSLNGTEDIDGTGNSLRNQVSGNFGDNVLMGLAGDDVVMTAAEGLDTLVGGAGSDIFRFDSQSKDGLDLVADFDGLPDRDTIDVGALLGIVTPATASGFLRAISLNGNTTLQIDTNGGADSFVDLAVLQGVSTDLDGLIANGAIVGIGTLIPAPTAGTAGNDTLAAAATSTLVQGLAGNDSLAGGAGLDTLDGGTGTDTLAGGAGDDTYIVDSTKDAIAESSGANDRILASITIDLQNVVYDGIEHATLSGTGAINATGDDGVNMLIGNAGANKLDGKGGEDVMIGGAGSDTYEVDEQDDLVIEYAGEGTDQVNSLISYTLGDFQENLTLTGLAGISGNGNELGNKITGNAGDNFLSGNGGNDTLTGNDGSDQLHGGGGADSMTGGTGNDTYYFDDIGDKIAETSAAGGTDSVNSSLTYTLGANLEKLSLLGGADIDGTGNTLANVIVGNDGDNVLSGLTGNDTLEGAAGDDQLLGGDGLDLLRAEEGGDTLLGGAGSDIFAFDATSLDGRDVIADFSGLAGGDLIDLSGLLGGFNAAVNNINNFLRTSIENGSTVLQVDQDGAANGANFVDVAVLQGVTTDVLGLLSNGSLVLAD